jgi:hypothetical protein
MITKPEIELRRLGLVTVGEAPVLPENHIRAYL